MEWKTIDEHAKEIGLCLLYVDGYYRLGSFGVDENYIDEDPQWFDDSYDDFSLGYASNPINPTYYLELKKPK